MFFLLVLGCGNSSVESSKNDKEKETEVLQQIQTEHESESETETNLEMESEEEIETETESQTESDSETESEEESETEESEDPEDGKNYDGWTTDEILADMTLEEKVYQMFVVTPEQLTGTGTVTNAGETTKNSLKKYPVGGIIFFASNLTGPSQTKTMLANLQTYSYEITGLPIFTCVDEEGGRVARIANNSAFGVTNVGPMANISDSTTAYNAGATMGKYLSNLGFNWNFAPDADVITNSANTVIGNRSFGSDSELVTELALQVSKGLNVYGVLSTFKHFPGHGATEGDTHEGYAYTNKTYDELLQAELVPFAAAQAGGVDAIMIAHISLPNVIGDNTPCTLSYKVVTEILRNDLGYRGLIVTDAMNMGAIVNNYSSANATVKAVQAGCDVILMPKDFHAAANALIEAVENGTISEDRIDASVRRIINVKKRIINPKKGDLL